MEVLRRLLDDWTTTLVSLAEYGQPTVARRNRRGRPAQWSRTSARDRRITPEKLIPNSHHLSVSYQEAAELDCVVLLILNELGGK